AEDTSTGIREDPGEHTGQAMLPLPRRLGRQQGVGSSVLDERLEQRLAPLLLVLVVCTETRRKFPVRPAEAACLRPPTAAGVRRGTPGSTDRVDLARALYGRIFRPIARSSKTSTVEGLGGMLPETRRSAKPWQEVSRFRPDPPQTFATGAGWDGGQSPSRDAT